MTKMSPPEGVPKDIFENMQSTIENQRRTMPAVGEYDPFARKTVTEEDIIQNIFAHTLGMIGINLEDNSITEEQATAQLKSYNHIMGTAHTLESILPKED